MRFQIAHKHRYNTRILVGTTIYPVDARGCVTVTNPADVQTFRAMPNEWHETDLAELPQTSEAAVLVNAAPGGPALVEQRTRTAADLVRDVQTDAGLLEKLQSFRSAPGRQAWLRAQGYRCTEEELAAALEAAVAPLEASPRAAGVDALPAGRTGMQEAAEKAPSVPVDVPKWTEPAEGEDWPDPTEDMPLDYLRAMAAAYAVRSTSKTRKADLVTRIHAAMYPAVQTEQATKPE